MVTVSSKDSKGRVNWVTSKPSKIAWSLWLSTDFSTWVVTAPAQQKIMADGPDGPNGADGLGLGFFLGPGTRWESVSVHEALGVHGDL